jgi:hypothetical protein
VVFVIRTCRLLVIAGLVAGMIAVVVFMMVGRSNEKSTELSRRPLVANARDCRKEPKVESLSKDLGPLTGSGPIRVVGDQWNFHLGEPVNFGSKRWGGNKLLIAVHRSVGDVLVRGKGVTPGTAQVGFGNDAEPVFSRDLRVENRPVLDGGWIDFPNTIRLEKQGCYILQFDFAGGTTRMALRAVPVRFGK